MSFQNLCVNGVRLQDSAEFEDWAVKMFKNSCRMCNTYNLGIDCDCDRCPIWLAHQRALERINNRSNNQTHTVSNCITKFSGEPDTKVTTQKVPAGDVRELPMIPTRLYNSLVKNNLVCISDVRKVVEDGLEIEGVGARGMAKLKECLDAFDKKHGRTEEKDETVQQTKRKYNRTVTVVFESEKFSKEEWMILNLLIKKGGRVKRKGETE